MRHETPSLLRIQKARTALVLDHPFFGSLLFRLKDCECRSIPTMATDGLSLYYNPDFVETLNTATLVVSLLPDEFAKALESSVQEIRPDANAIKAAAMRNEHVRGAEVRRGSHLRVA